MAFIKEIRRMALTAQQQTSILQLTQVIFNSTPGAIFLDALGDQVSNGKSFADLAQSLSGTNQFFGSIYNDVLPSQFANSFIDDLVSDYVSVSNKTWATNYIIGRMAAGATQAEVVLELTQTLSSIPASDPDWGEAATSYNTRIAEKLVSRLAGNTITAEDKAFAVNYILAQMAAGQTFGAMVEWAITALDGIDHTNPVWGDAAALFDNRIEVSRYYSVDKVGAATSPLMLQYILSQVPAGVTLDMLIKSTITMLSNTPHTVPDSAQSSIELAKILASVTADAATVDTAKAAIDDFLKGNINLHSLNGSNGFRLVEELVGNYPNHKVSSAGDFNGDGFDDLMIGVENSKSFESSEIPSDTGYIVFGKNSGFGATLDLSNLDGSNGFRIDGITENVSEEFSVSSAGDVNADGFDDLIIGTTLSVPDRGYSGNAHVIFGKAAGFNASLDLSRLDGSNGFRVNGLVVAEDPGNFVSNAGDFNGDGFDDLIIGSPLTDSSYLIFGKASGFDAALNLTNLSADKGFRLSGIATGNTVNTAGDVNGDGFDDLIIGAPYAGLSGENPGSSYVVFGNADGFKGTFNLSGLDGSNGFRLDGAAKGDEAGYSISTAGDVNGDGFDDLIIGAPDADPNGNFSGSSYVVFGKASGFNAVLDLSSLNGDNGFRLDGEREFSGAGSSVSGIGDFNGDGFDDLMIGAPSADPGGFRVGASYIVFGKDSGFSPTFKLSSLDGSNGLILKGPQLNGRLGDFISNAGDANGDGFDDVIMSVSESDIAFFGSRSSYVVLGANYTNAVTFLGTPGADNLTAGTIAPESFVAGDGNDLMIGGGGADAFHGGAGNDIIKVSGLDFRLADGGSGSDTLALTSSGLNLNLTEMRGKIDGIETIDLTGSGNNTLTASLLDLLNLSDTSNTVKVNGNAGDIVTGLSSGWIDGGISGDYHTYTLDAAVLLVGTGVTIHFVS